MRAEPFPCSFCGNPPSGKHNAAGGRQAGRVATICETCARDALALLEDLRNRETNRAVALLRKLEWACCDMADTCCGTGARCPICDVDGHYPEKPHKFDCELAKLIDAPREQAKMSTQPKWATVKRNAKDSTGNPHPLAGREVLVVGETFWNGKPVPLLETSDGRRWWAQPDDIK